MVYDVESAVEHLPELLLTQVLTWFLVSGEFRGKETESPQSVNNSLETQPGAGIGITPPGRSCVSEVADGGSPANLPENNSPKTACPGSGHLESIDGPDSFRTHDSEVLGKI